MRRRFVLFVSNTTGFRVGSIVHGVLQECHRLKVGLLWREFDGCDIATLREPPLGIVAWGKSAAIESLIAQVKGRIPIVSTIGHTLALPILTVVPDPIGIARQVAGHLVEEGLRNFIFVGSQKNPAARLRAEAFESELKQRLKSASFRFFNVDLEDRFWGGHTERGLAFIQLLKKRDSLPVGVFAFNDQIAASCLECADLAEVRVPQQMSIVGVDDHPIFARMYLPLSTIKIDYAEIGRTAVKLLVRPRESKRTGSRNLHHFVGGTLVVRESSRPRLLGDPQISKILHFMHDNYTKVVTLVELAHQAGMSRASFAAKFQRAVGQSPIRYLIDFRLDQAKLLLAESPLTISEISYRVGFEDQGYFTRAFKKRYRITPTDYRRAKTVKRLMDV